MKKSNLKKALKEQDARISAYKKAIHESEKTFRQLNSDNMQATLIQFEDYLDSNHLYAFENWIDGVIWDGPNIKRYWVIVTLKYPYEKMPDPKGALRLVNTGAKISYKKTIEYVPIKVKNPDDIDPATRKPKEEIQDIWLVTVKVPRRFIEGAIDDEFEEPEDQKQAEPSEEPSSEPEGETPEAPAEEGEELEL